MLSHEMVKNRAYPVLAVDRSKVVILLLLIHFCWCLQLCVGVYVGSLFCNIVLSILSSFEIIFLRKRELVALLYHMMSRASGSEITQCHKID